MPCRVSRANVVTRGSVVRLQNDQRHNLLCRGKGTIQHILGFFFVFQKEK